MAQPAAQQTSPAPERPELFWEAFEFIGRQILVGTSGEAARSAVRAILRGFGPVPAVDALRLPRFSMVSSAGAWQIEGEGKSLYPPAEFLIALSRLEWHVVDEALSRRADVFQMHAGAVSLPTMRAGLVLAGRSGAGKSTLTMALMLRGFTAFSDDVTVVSPERLELLPFPRAFHVEDHTWQVLEPVAGALLRADPGVPKGYFCPPQWAHQPVPVRWIVFPEYLPGQAPELTRMTRAEAAGALVENTGTLHRASRLALRTAVRMAEEIPCYRFAAGDLAASVAVLQRLAYEES